MTENIIFKGVNNAWLIETPQLIGTGGNSKVYKVKKVDKNDDNTYALKLFMESTKSPIRLLRFEREIEIVKGLANIEGCSQVIDHGYLNDQPFYVMPFYSGGDLYKKYIKHRDEQVSILEILQTFKSLSLIIKKLHALSPGLAIRDIKPQNILLDHKNDPIICDFGLALWANTPDEERLTTSHVIGSTGYRPPEWAAHYPERDQVSGDIWSMGRTLWAIISGKNPPANFDSLGTKKFHLKNKLVDNNISNAIQGLINHTTLHNTADRPNINQLIESLDNIIDYCANNGMIKNGTSFDELLADLAINLNGSTVIATASQKKAELDSKLLEIEDAQKILIDSLRIFQPKLEAAVSTDIGSFGVFGNQLDYSTNLATAYISFFPSQSLVQTRFAKEIKYIFYFGLNSDYNFAWWEEFIFDGIPRTGELINPSSLTGLAIQKSKQIENILKSKFIVGLKAMLT